MKSVLMTALRVSLATLLLTGVAYPLTMTGLAQIFFPWRADGSLLDVNGARARVGEGAIGSELLAQRFVSPGYFQPRPSAADYNASASSGSNLGSTSKALRDRVQAELARLFAENPEARGPTPIELVTASGSGLDPHLSPEAARWQAPRIAKARGVDAARVLRLIEGQAEGRTLGFLGEPRVNVLRLNLALERQFGALPAAFR